MTKIQTNNQSRGWIKFKQTNSQDARLDSNKQTASDWIKYKQANNQPGGWLRFKQTNCQGLD